jgi:hypothetical protein
MRPTLPICLLALAACSPQPADEGAANAVQATPAPTPEPTPAPPDNIAANAAEPAAPGTPGGLADDATPPDEAAFAATSAQGAADVVQHYFALIEEGAYARAWRLWEEGGRPGKTVQDFAAGFARYAEYHAEVGAPGEIDAGAGQRYVTVPIQTYGRVKDGTPFRAAARVTLHRVGEIDGATAEQKRWHIRGID